MGMTLSEVTPELMQEFQLSGNDGLVVTQVAADSEAADKGIQPGDLITEAGQQKVVTVSDLEDRVDEAKEAGRKSILLLVRRGGDPRFVALSLDE